METGSHRLFHDLDPDLDEHGDDLSLTCPACGADLVQDQMFLHDRVCKDCGRHFSMPARERIQSLLDEGSFRDVRDMPSLEGLDNDQISALDRIADQRERPILDEAIVTGTGKIGGLRVVVIAMDDQYVSAQIGALGAEKIILALELAHSRRLPVVALIAGGGSSVQAGPLAAVQGARISSVASQVRRAGIPMIAVLTHPTSASVYSTFASHFDFIFAESGTHVGVTWSAGSSLDAVGSALAEDDLLRNGWIDGVIARPQLRQRLDELLALLGKRPPEAEESSRLSADDRMTLATSTGQHLLGLLTPFIELRGDRTESDDRSVICGFGRLEDHVVAIAVQDPSVPVGDARAALRKMQRITTLAGKLEMPLILFLDSVASEGPVHVTPGESLGSAKLANTIAMLPVSVITVGAGRIQGLASVIMMAGDRRLMFEDSSYHLPMNGAARGGRVPSQASGQYWSARECERLGLIDGIIDSAPEGSPNDPSVPARLLRTEVNYILTELSRVGPRRLVETRQRRHRVLGQETEAGIAAIRNELHDLQDLQQSFAKSLEEWRERMGQRMASQPRLSFQRPDLSEMAARVKARQEELRQELLERTGRADRSGE